VDAAVEKASVKPPTAAPAPANRFQSNRFLTSKTKKEGKMTGYHIDAELAQKLRLYAAENRTSASKIVNDLIVDFLAGHRKSVERSKGKNP
jgi:hypothetical protein